MTRRFALLTLPLTAGLALLGPATLAGAASKPKIKSGFYSSLVGVRSADVEFHARSGGTRIPDLSFNCLPNATLAQIPTGDEDIGIHMPAVKISHGKFSYRGAAKVTGASAGTPKIAESTLRITGTWVNGPVHHYTYEGNHLSQTRAWVGTASSPACKSTKAAKFTLFGPVAGE